MQIQTNNISPNKITNWNTLLKNHPHNTVFQSPDMYNFYKKVQNFEPFLFYADDENRACNGILLAVLIKEGKGIKGYLSSRVVVYGGPIISENNKNKNKILHQLLEALDMELRYKSMFIQFRNFFEWDAEEKQVFFVNGFYFRERLNLLVDTTEHESTISNLSTSKRRQIRNGIHSGAQIVEAQDEEDIRIFFDLLRNLYKNKVRKPMPSWSFFKEFYNFSKEGKLGIIRLIKYNNKIIGGILSPVTVNKNIYEWYIVGLDAEYKKQYPSVLATWAPIEYASNNKLAHFDFMGLGKPDEHYGVRDFKMKFGKNVVNYGRFGRRNNKILYGFVEIGYNLLRSIGKI